MWKAYCGGSIRKQVLRGNLTCEGMVSPAAAGAHCGYQNRNAVIVGARVTTCTLRAQGMQHAHCGCRNCNAHIVCRSCSAYRSCIKKPLYRPKEAADIVGRISEHAAAALAIVSRNQDLSLQGLSMGPKKKHCHTRDHRCWSASARERRSAEAMVCSVGPSVRGRRIGTGAEEDRRAAGRGVGRTRRR